MSENNSMEVEGQEDNNIFNVQGNLNSNENNSQINLDSEEITDQDCWKVISAYFSQHGLVSQQIGSFNQFVRNNIQDIVDESRMLPVELDPSYKNKGSEPDPIIYEINFNQANIAENPQFLENNEKTSHKLYPNDAREIGRAHV